MMVWKDRLTYSWPQCQLLILQSAQTKRFRLKAIAVKNRCGGSRYDDNGDIVTCDHSFVIDGVRTLRVKLNNRFTLKNQFRELNYGDWHRRIPLLNRGMNLVEIANLCGMTPIGEVVTLKGE